MGTVEAEIVGFDFGLEAAFEAGFDDGKEALGGASEGLLGGQGEVAKTPALHFDGHLCYPDKSVSSRRRVSWEAS